jgi:DNA-binding beta-propeller fold protein YncE
MRKIRVVSAMVVLWLAACGSDQSPLDATDCLAPQLPLQNPRAHTLGETFYLPSLLARSGCPMDARWKVTSAPVGSENPVYRTGASEPRFTPDVEGDYVLAISELAGSELALRVVSRTPAERFRNHHLTPLYGAALVDDEIWTANGASYTVTRVGADGSSRGEVTVGAWPGALAWRAPMPYVLVASRGSDTIGFIDRTRGVLEDALWVGDEPAAIVVSSDGARAWVSLPTMRQVAEIDLAAREVVARLDVGFDPRALALAKDDRRLYAASYRSGNAVKDTMGTYGPGEEQDVWIIDTELRTVVRTVSGVSANLRAIALSPADDELFIAASDGDPIPSQADPNAKSFVHEVVVLSVEPSASDFGQVRRRADLTRQVGSGGPVVNPAGILVVGDQVYVAAESSNVVVALDAASLEERWRMPVGVGARQLLALPDGVAVHCFSSRELWRLRTDGSEPRHVALADEARPEPIAVGERVFMRPGAGFASNHSCSSCHIEAQNDGMVWRFGPGVNNNIRPLQLLDATTPLEWKAYVSGTQNFGYQGPSSIVGRPASPEEARGLAQFLGSLLGAPRATGYTRLDGSYSESGLRGKALFEGKATCTRCHAPPLYTIRKVAPVGKSGEPADIPSLLGVYRHGVYMMNGQARSLDAAVDVALDFVEVALSAEERADLLAFLRELTPKGGAPLAIWPDLDSDRGVYSDVQPTVAFADPIDDSVPGRTAAQVAAEYVRLEDAGGAPVDANVTVTGGTVRVGPVSPLLAGQRYVFRVLPGLPFVSGGTLESERRSEFTVARDAIGRWPEVMQMTVTVAGPMGGTTPVPLLLRKLPSEPGALRIEIEPIVFGKQQRQSVWLRIDGDKLYLQAFALPIGPSAVADASSVIGTVTADGGVIASASGTLRIGGPGIDIPGVPFTIGPPTPVALVEN